MAERVEKKKVITIEGARFIFRTNFEGNPDNDNYRSSERKGNIVIPDVMQARELIDAGFNVKMTKPKDGEEEGFIPTYFVMVKVNYDTNWPPKVYLVSGDNEPILLDEDSISIIDNCRIQNVDVVLNPYHSERNNTNSLYVRTMYVTQAIDDDPFTDRYRGRRAECAYDEPVPFA